MIQTIKLHESRQAFHDCGRGEQFSYEALGLIFDWFEQVEQDTGAPYELDVIAICCDIAEMTAEEAREAYDIDATVDGDCADVIQHLDDHTSVIGQTDDTIIFFQF